MMKDNNNKEFVSLLKFNNNHYHNYMALSLSLCFNHLLILTHLNKNNNKKKHSICI